MAFPVFPVLIQFQSIYKRYGVTVIFDEASVLLDKRDKVGVIGRNGAGKSTLCKLLLEEEEVDSGQIQRSSQLRLSYLEQRSPFEGDESVLAFLMRHSGREDWQCGKLAGRFQLKGELLEQPATSLPGGYQTRVKLAAMLLAEPNFLVLDEPTNYLDLKTLLLLERFLRDFSGGFLIVSHDRAFLKKTCTKTLEVERGKLNMHRGDVEDYLATREAQLVEIERYNKNVEAKRKDLQQFVDRYRVRAATASRAQSKLKEMERLKTIDVDNPLGTARIRLPEVEPKRGVALRVKDLSIGYPDTTVAKGIQFEMDRGEHVAILGDNGEGKTTFLRTLTGELESLGGSFQWGHALEISYYAQHVYSALPEKLDVYNYLEQTGARDVGRQEILDMAGGFLFRGDDVSKPISVLSGGERSRLCLAGLLLSKRPVLLLDEPTNHLDFETVEALGDALRKYKGTVFFISHDRTFVGMVATSVVEVKGGRVALYPGDYASYVDRVEREIDADEAVVEKASGRAPKKTGAADAPRGKELRAQKAKLRTEIRKAEKEVERWTREQKTLHAHFLEHPTDFNKEKVARSETLKRLLPEAEERWLALQAELEELQ